MEHKRTMTSSSHYRHYESWPGCAGEAVVKVQRGKGTRMSNSPRGGSNREVVRKEISVRIIIACGHDIRGVFAILMELVVNRQRSREMSLSRRDKSTMHKGKTLSTIRECVFKYQGGTENINRVLNDGADKSTLYG